MYEPYAAASKRVEHSGLLELTVQLEHDETAYRLLTREFVSTVTVGGKTFTTYADNRVTVTEE